MLQFSVYLLDSIASIVYLFGPWKTHILPEGISLWPYFAGVLYIVVANVSYAMYHTSYSLARNYLLSKDGFYYDSGTVFALVNLLQPTWYPILFFLHCILNPLAYIWLLSSQGLGPALGMAIISYGIGVLGPKNYPFFLRFIKRRLADLNSTEYLVFSRLGVDLDSLCASVIRYIYDKENLHDLYITRVTAAAQKEADRRISEKQMQDSHDPP